MVGVGRPRTGNRNDCKAWEESGATAAAGRTLTIADGGHAGTGRVIPHRRKRGQSQLPDRKEEHNTFHKQVRPRVEQAFAHMKTWEIIRDCRLGRRLHHAVPGIARMYNLTLAGLARVAVPPTCPARGDPRILQGTALSVTGRGGQCPGPAGFGGPPVVGVFGVVVDGP